MSTLLTSSRVFSLLVMWKNIIVPPSTPFSMVNTPYKAGFWTTVQIMTEHSAALTCSYSARVPQTKLPKATGRMMRRVRWQIRAVVLSACTGVSGTLGLRIYLNKLSLITLLAPESSGYSSAAPAASTSVKVETTSTTMGTYWPYIRPWSICSQQW